MDLIIYHGGCTDGWCAAYIAKKRYPEAILRPAFFSTDPPYDEIEGKDVLIVDFAWKTREVNIKMNLLAKSLLILDHHKTNAADLEGLEFVRFDMKRSGAGMTWDYLFGKDKGEWNPADPFNIYRPWWVNYVEDYDTWNKALSNTDEINAYLHALPHTIESWDQISLDTALTIGSGMRKQIEHQAREMVSALTQRGSIDGYTAGVINAPYLFASEIGAELGKKFQIGMTWYERRDGIISFSMRSNNSDPEAPDVSAIAKARGGGGHKHAAGFELSTISGRDLVDKILGRERDTSRDLVWSR